MNNYESIRQNLRFVDIIVSFTGTANVSGATVFGQHVYDYVDANIGYTFANVLVTENGKMVVDAELLNDVMEQNGGGAEPFSDRRVESRGFATEALATVVEGVAEATTVVGTQTKAAAGQVAEMTKEGVSAAAEATTLVGTQTKAAAGQVAATTKAGLSAAADRVAGVTHTEQDA